MTAPPQKTIPRPITTEVTIAGVSLKWRNVNKTIPAIERLFEFLLMVKGI